MKKYKQFFKKITVSLSTTVVDLILFQLICHSSKKLLIIYIATVISRAISTILQFTFDKIWVFKNETRKPSQFIKFVILVTCQLTTSALLVWLLSFIPIPQIFIKMVVDSCLFFVAYYIEKKFIFKKKET